MTVIFLNGMCVKERDPIVIYKNVKNNDGSFSLSLSLPYLISTEKSSRNNTVYLYVSQYTGYIKMEKRKLRHFKMNSLIVKKYYNKFEFKKKKDL